MHDVWAYTAWFLSRVPFLQRCSEWYAMQYKIVVAISETINPPRAIQCKVWPQNCEIASEHSCGVVFDTVPVMHKRCAKCGEQCQYSEAL